MILIDPLGIEDGTETKDEDSLTSRLSLTRHVDVEISSFLAKWITLIRPSKESSSIIIRSKWSSWAYSDISVIDVSFGCVACFL